MPSDGRVERAPRWTWRSSSSGFPDRTRWSSRRRRLLTTKRLHARAACGRRPRILACHANRARRQALAGVLRLLAVQPSAVSQAAASASQPEAGRGKAAAWLNSIGSGMRGPPRPRASSRVAAHPYEAYDIKATTMLAVRMDIAHACLRRRAWRCLHQVPPSRQDGRVFAGNGAYPPAASSTDPRAAGRRRDGRARPSTPRRRPAATWPRRQGPHTPIRHQ